MRGGGRRPFGISSDLVAPPFPKKALLSFDKSGFRSLRPKPALKSGPEPSRPLFHYAYLPHEDPGP